MYELTQSYLVFVECQLNLISYNTIDAIDTSIDTVNKRDKIIKNIIILSVHVIVQMKMMDCQNTFSMKI